jgi:hypothetical protein
MVFRDLLKKKDKHGEEEPQPPLSPPPEFKIYRSDTHGTELISESGDGDSNADGAADTRSRGLFGRHRSSSNASAKSVSSTGGTSKRLSQRLHLRKEDTTSDSVPTNLPDITADDAQDEDGRQSQWEKRATILARKNEQSRSRPTTPTASTTDLDRFRDLRLGDNNGQQRDRSVSSKRADDNIQEAIRLHEAGDLETATKMFGRLADPNGENNALSQVLYGLALR